MTDPLRILIVDDNLDDRLFYRRTLQKSTQAKYIVVEADSGEQILETIQKEKPVCVLLDYSMPGRNGVEVLKLIRSQHPFLPVVMMTGQASEVIAVTAIQEGAQNYIAKSMITPEALERVIRIAIEYCAMQQRIDDQRNSLEIFTRALAHDLKEPVSTIRSFIDVIHRAGALPPKAQEYFHCIQSAADRMLALIDTVHLYTRLDSPTQAEKENIALGDVLHAAEENLRDLISQSGAVIKADKLPEVSGNRTQIMQVLQNLLSNAIRYSKGAPVIEISTKERADDWLISVKDNGTGISEGNTEKIFEPFKRLANGSAQGLGLGLAICRRIIESHEGRIWCESQPGQGATFHFSLPKAKAKAEKASNPEVAVAPAQVVRAGNTSEKTLANILLVDDNKMDIELARIMLIEEPHLKCNLVVAQDGYEALTLLQDNQQNDKAFDLILLDINMPKMHGFELLEKVKAQESLRDIPVVMCTTSNYDKDMQRAKSLGAAGYMTKPAELDKLKPIINRLSSVKLSQDDNGYELLRSA